MSEITQPPPDVPTQDSNSRVNRLNAASDQSTSNNQSAEQQPGKQTAESEPEKQVSHHDPAVTLASTLSKLDTGSYFQATVTGQDSDGRTILQSDLGTYLVEVEKSHLDEFKKIHKDELLELRVVTIDKEIKAEIIRSVETEGGKQQVVTIPVSLTLTELGHSSAQTTSNPADAKIAQQPLEDIRSQYNATTLYRAERIAREIGEKLDNLPLPTSAPNYTVFGSSPPATEQSADASPKKVSSNVFIQEVSTSAAHTTAAGLVAQQASTINKILGRNISVEVIKTVPQTTIALPESLPEAVKSEIRALTPLDNVTKGQSLNIKISAVAVPEAREQVAIQAQASAPIEAQNTPTPQATTTQISQPAVPLESTVPASDPAKGQQAKPVISGIIVDALQPGAANVSANVPQKNPAPQSSYAQNVSAAGGTGKSETGIKNYYLATPSTVLKFASSTPLLAGTIVSFSVSQDAAPAQENKTSKSTEQLPTNPSSGQSNTSTTSFISSEPIATQSTQSPTSSTPLNSIAPTLADRIDQFFPQELVQLTEEWGSISLAMSALTTTASTGMAAIMASRIPNMQSPEQLSSTMFFFLSALKSATPARTWMGPDVSARLRQLGAARAIDRIEHDFSRIARLGAEVPTGEWRPFLVPAQNGPDFLAIPLIVKHIGGEENQEGNQSDPNDEGNDKNATRFILEVNFSELGRVVIDGLLKKSRLDLILKSNELIPHAVKSHLSRKFSDAIENAKFEGELVIIDNAPTEVSVTKMIDTMTHKAKIEKKI